MNQARHIDVETLNALIDDAVPAAERQEITRHLTGCPTCQREFHELRAIARLCAGLPQFAPARVFTLGPEYQRAAVHPRAIRILPILRSLSVAAVLIFVLLSAFAVINTRQSSASSPEQSAPVPQTRAGAMAAAPSAAKAPAATQPVAEQAQVTAPKSASVGAQAAPPASTSSATAAGRDRSLSGWWVASLIVGLGTALLLLAWFALDRGATRRLSRA